MSFNESQKTNNENSARALHFGVFKLPNTGEETETPRKTSRKRVDGRKDKKKAKIDKGKDQNRVHVHPYIYHTDKHTCIHTYNSECKE